jgi:iron complex outermembrane receptor protein
MISVGADYRVTSFTTQQEDVAEKALILFDSPVYDNHYQRANAGAFAELLLPINKQWEATVSGRFDHIGAVKDEAAGQGRGRQRQRRHLQSLDQVLGRQEPDAACRLRHRLPRRQHAGNRWPAGRVRRHRRHLQLPADAANGLGGHPLAKYCEAGRGQFEVFKAAIRT